MKKLMMTLGAAAMFSLAAQAYTDKAPWGDMNFQGYTDVKTVTPGAADPGDNGGLTYWAGTAGDSVIKADDSNLYLGVDTSDVLIRQLSSDSTTLKPATIPANGGNITISSKVQFTAADDKPEATATDKIIVWAQSPHDNVTTTNLMVTAMGDDGSAKAFDTGKTVVGDQWYTLTITAKETADTSAASPLVFTVALDGETVDATYKSMLKTGETGAATIASVGFKGTGAVDDIAFTSEAGAELVDVTLTNADSLELYADNVGGDPFDPSKELTDVAIGSKVYFWVEGEADGYTVTNAAIEDDGDSGYAKVTITVAKDLTVTIAKAAGSIEVKAPKGEGWTAAVDPESAAVGATITVTYTAADGKVFKDGSTTKTATGTLDADGNVVFAEGSKPDTDTLALVKVTITAQDNTKVSTITSNDVEVATLTQAVEGDKIVVTFVADENYKLDGDDTVTVEKVGTEAVTITGPTATYVPVTVTVTCDYDSEAVEVTLEGVTDGKATEGGTITVTAAAKEGYENVKVTIKDVETTTVTVGTSDITIKVTATKKEDTPVVDPSAGGSTVVVTAASEADAKAAGIAAIKAPEGVEAATYQDYFTATATKDETTGKWTVTVALDAEKVTPAIDATSETASLDIDAGKIAVTTKAGLYYQLIRGADVKTITTQVAEEKGTGSTLQLKDAEPPSGAGFYKVQVTAQKQTTDEK